VAGLIAEFNETPLPAAARLEILETLRSQFIEIDRLYAGRYVGKPLPLGPAERNAFDHARALWGRLEQAYWQCAQAALAGEISVQPRLVLCLTRAAQMACMAIAGHARAGQMIGAESFYGLQRYFLAAQHAKLLDAAVADSLHPKRSTSVAAVYRCALLTRLGAGAASGREREAVLELAEAWASKISIAWLPADSRRQLSRDDLPPAPDNARQCVKTINTGMWMHMLDMTHISRSLRRRLHKLGRGAKPDELRLPASFHHAGIDDLLKRLHGAWCEEARGRAHNRLARKGAAADNRVSMAFVGNDFGTLFYMAGGEPFAFNTENPLGDRRHAEELFMFQHVARARIDARAEEAARQFEDWELQDESADGFRVKRERAGLRFRRGQLTALRLPATPAGGVGAVLLAEIRWLAEPPPAGAGAVPGAVMAGLQILHGRPHGVGLRATGINSQGGRHFQPAFLLRAAVAGGSGFRLVSPAGWFKPHRVVEIRDGEQIYRLALEKLLQRGVDFEVMEAFGCS
jgi:hypothetical protein